MNNPHQVDRPDLIEILDNFGKVICQDKTEYLTPITTSSSTEGQLIEFSLYILAPEISYEYRVINIERLNVSTLKIAFYTLATNQSELYEVDIYNNTSLFEAKLLEISTLSLFKSAMDSLIYQVQIKRESRLSPIQEKIVPGQARVAILLNDQRINVGWIEIEGDDVFYYTGLGLREIWRSNMSQEDQMKANFLKGLSREQLINSGHIAMRKIYEFKDIL